MVIVWNEYVACGTESIINRYKLIFWINFRKDKAYKDDKEEFTFEYYINNYGMCEDDEGRRYYTPTSMEEYNSYLWAAFAPSSEE